MSRKFSKVVNHSRLLVERAERVRCPRYGGSGGISCDARAGVDCFACAGKGETWRSVTGSGWLRPIGARLESGSVLW